MYKISLITENDLKESGLLDKNVYSEYTLQAIEIAQDQGLQPLIGSVLYEKLRNEEQLSIDDESKTELMEIIKKYLIWQSIGETQMLNNYKNRQAGTIYANDVNYNNLQINDIEHLATFYFNKARFYGNQLSKWLEHSDIAEYYQVQLDGIKPNKLNYNTGLYLKKPKGCKGEIVGTKENIEALLKKIQLLEAEVEMLKESVEPLQAEVLQLRTENNQLRTTINNLNNTIAQKEQIIISQQQTIANLSSLDIDDIIDKLDNIDNKVVGVGTKVNTIDSNINNGFTLTNSNISNLGADIDTIDTKVDGVNNSVNSVDNKVTNIDNKVALQGNDITATNTATYERIGDVGDIIQHLNNIQI